MTHPTTVRVAIVTITPKWKHDSFFKSQNECHQQDLPIIKIVLSGLERNVPSGNLFFTKVVHHSKTTLNPYICRFIQEIIKSSCRKSLISSYTCFIPTFKSLWKIYYWSSLYKHTRSTYCTYLPTTYLHTTRKYLLSILYIWTLWAKYLHISIVLKINSILWIYHVHYFFANFNLLTYLVPFSSTYLK